MNHPRGYRYFHVVAMLFIASLIVANTLAVKIIQVGSFSLPAGILCFPIAYIVNDCLTEVYGYEKTRSVIWWGFFCLAMMSGLYYLATLLKPAIFWSDQDAFARLFGFVPRIAGASLVAFLIGSFLNSWVMSLMKVKTKGKRLWTRTIGSTIIGEGADSLVFNYVAFLGIFSFGDVMEIALSGFVLKTLYEIIMTPFTYIAIGWLKRKEEEDKFDTNINYNPFKS
jgi:queuosine precursor transporter